jgi:excinuclease ABC subunit C
LGLDPGLEEGKTSLADYKANLRKLMQYLKGERLALTRQIEKDMKAAARAKDFEAAAGLRNQLFSLQELSRQVLFSDREKLDISKDHALADIAGLMGLAKPPRRIEGFDISHMQGTDVVASMVVFVNGVPDKSAYRKFKMKVGGNNDFANMAETLGRRLREDNLNKWGKPDLMLIDGGKGQLSAALKVRDELGLGKIPMLGLAKRMEEIIIHKSLSMAGLDADEFIKRAQELGGYTSESGGFIILALPSQANIIKLLQRIRDESHRFAVSYHSTLKRNRQASSILDEIPGIGPTTRRKLIKHFGSARGAISADPADVQKLLGDKRGKTIAKYLASYQN